MDGVTILNTVIIPATEEQNYWWIGALLGVLMGLMLYVMVIVLTKDNKFGLILGICIGFVSVVVFVFGFCTNPTPAKPEVSQYEATISDEVNFTEFMNKYTIIEQRGEIWVVEEVINDAN